MRLTLSPLHLLKSSYRRYFQVLSLAGVHDVKDLPGVFVIAWPLGATCLLIWLHSGFYLLGMSKNVGQLFRCAVHVAMLKPGLFTLQCTGGVVIDLHRDTTLNWFFYFVLKFCLKICLNSVK